MARPPGHGDCDAGGRGDGNMWVSIVLVLAQVVDAHGEDERHN